MQDDGDDRQRLRSEPSEHGGPSPGRAFLACVTRIVGRTDADLYASRFQPLDAAFTENLTNDEGLAFYIYTTGMAWHDAINGALWSGRAGEDVMRFTEVLNRALDKLPRYRTNGGLVYRGYRATEFENFLAGYETGKVVVFSGFTSAAFQEEGAFGGNVLFVIRTLTARAVWYVSAKFDEYEVLIPAGRSFLVLDIETGPNTAVVYLEEQP